MTTASLSDTAPASATSTITPGAPGTPGAPALWNIENAGDNAVIIRAGTVGAIEPADWRERLLACLNMASNLVAVGAKRVDSQGHLFSMGEFIIHPKGFHHLGKGIDGRCFRWPEEVDLIAGGVLAVDRQWFEKLNGKTMLQGQLGAVILGLMLRHAGGRCIAVPSVVATDTFAPNPTPDEQSAFRQIFGFDWRSPDLGDVYQKFAHSGMLWNARFHCPVMPFDKYEYRPALVWNSYKEAEVFRQRAHHIVRCIQTIAGAGPLLEIGSGDGLFTHLFAQTGLEVVGVEPEPKGVAQAQAQTAGQTYPGPRPRFEPGNALNLPFPDASFAAACLIDVIEHIPNPIRGLRQAARVIRPGGKLLVVTPSWQYGGNSDPAYHNFEYTTEELVNQVNAVPGLTVTNTGQIGGVYRDIVVVAEKATGG